MATDQHATEFVKADIRFDNNNHGPQQPFKEHPDNSLESDHSSLSAVYSLSDMSLSSSSCSEMDEMAKVGLSPDSEKKQSTNFLFLPPLSSISYVDVPELPCQRWASPSNFSDCESLDSVCTPYNDKRGGTANSSLACISGHSVSSDIFELDIVSMREKLEAQKEYILGSFQKQQSFPLALTVQPRFPQVGKLTSHKMKEKLHKFGHSARRFWNNNILRRHPTIWRCEIELQGFDDRVDRLLLVISHKSSRPDTRQVYMYMPHFFETERVALPKVLLSSKPIETVTVTVYGTKVEENEKMPTFSQVLLSGVCTLHPDAVLLKGKVELQAHRPCLSLTAHSKTVQSCSNRLVTEHGSYSSYTFATQPKPVAQNFTEMCVIQMAQPFHEYFSMAASSCNNPALFKSQLSPGKYHAICSYRVTNKPVAGTYTVTSATPCVFFKAYIDKTRAEDTLKATMAELGNTDTEEHMLLPYLSLFKPLHLDMETLLETLRTRQGNQVTSFEPTKNDLDMTEEALYMCAWDMGVAQPNTAACKWNSGPTKSMNSPLTPTPCLSVGTPCLSVGNKDYILLPSLSIFNMNTRLYFADRWTYYEKLYVTLVLCKKGSPCQRVCKKNLPKLDPYNNPFLFRKRCFDPEPNISVHVSAKVNVEIIYSNGTKVQELISTCSENVYFSKVEVSSRSTQQ